MKILYWMAVGYIPIYWYRLANTSRLDHNILISIQTGMILSALLLWPLACWRIVSILWPRTQKPKNGPRQKRKSGRSYKSVDEFHADLEKRFGKPGRIPEDVA